MDKKSFLNDLQNLNLETTLSIAKKDVNHFQKIPQYHLNTLSKESKEKTNHG